MVILMGKQSLKIGGVGVREGRGEESGTRGNEVILTAFFLA